MHAGSTRALSAVTQTGKLVIPDWAGPTGSRASSSVDAISPRRPTGPYGYQPDFLNKQAAFLRQQAGGLRRNSSAALLVPSAATAAGTRTSEGDGASLVSRAGSPISRRASSAALFPSGGIARQPSVSASRARRPSLLGLAPPLVPSLHAVPEHDAYLGPPKPQRRSGEFAMSGTSTRKSSFEGLAGDSLPLTAQISVLDASLVEPEVVDQGRASPVELHRLSTSGSLEAASVNPIPVPEAYVQVGVSMR